MNKIDTIIATAEREIAEENQRLLVDKIKARIRERRALPWWRKLFPWTIKIRRL